MLSDATLPYKKNAVPSFSKPDACPVVAMIAAVASNGAIGKDNALLFHLPDDLKRFKSLTLGHTLIMGRRTLLSLPGWPLPGRRHIVLTSGLPGRFPGCETAASPEEALEMTKGEQEVFVIGGGSVYRQFCPIADKLYLTLVHRPFDGDTFFPEIDFEEWEQVAREDLYDKKNDFHYSYVNLVRKPAHGTGV